MSTQYNDIQGPYDYIRKKSISLIEHENVRDAVAPFVKGMRVLELACGSGFYTHDFQKWGASSVVAVDISPVMIEENRRQGGVDPSPNSRPIEYIVADCSKPTRYPGGPFDLVFGAWLLNYAPDHTDLVQMFRNIALNLESGGHFVSVTTPPAQDPIASLNAEFNARPPPEGSGGLVYYHLKDVKYGIYFKCFGSTPVGDVDFDNYHLRRDVYEAAARESGMRGELQWGLTSVPERYLRGEGAGGATMDELQSYLTVPNYGILVIAK